MFLATVKQVKLEVRPLFLPQLVQLTSLLKPGLHRIKVSFCSNKYVVQWYKKYSLFSCFFLAVDQSKMG